MKRRKSIKNIITALSLPLVPLGLLVKNDETAIHYQAGLDAIDMEIWDAVKTKAVDKADIDAAYLKLMYPQWKVVKEENGDLRYIGTSEFEI